MKRLPVEGSRGTVTVFGSATPRPGDERYEEARRTGFLLATAGFTVCNGGFGGTMEAGARGAREAGGRSIGVKFEDGMGRRANTWIDEEVRCATLLDRLRTLAERGDAYIVLRGGTGTLLELAAVWEFINKGLMREKPLVILGTLWEGVVRPLQAELAREGRNAAASLPLVAAGPEDAVAHIAARCRGRAADGTVER